MADELRKNGHRADFIGGSDSRMVGKQFDNIAGGSGILFPRGRKDMRSIQNNNRRSSNIDLVVYETLKHADHKIPYSDILIFTSPANVLTFLENNKIGNERVIAYGGRNHEDTKGKREFSLFILFIPSIRLDWQEASMQLQYRSWKINNCASE